MKEETDTDVQFLPNFQMEMNDGGSGGKENGKWNTERTCQNMELGRVVPTPGVGVAGVVILALFMESHPEWLLF